MICFVRASGFRQAATRSLAQSVRLTIERQSCGFDGVAHEGREAVHRERLAELGVDDGDVIVPRLFQHREQVPMQRHFDFRAGLLLVHLDAPGALADVLPRHPMHVGAALAGEEHQREGGALLGADLPAVLVLPDFVIGP